MLSPASWWLNLVQVDAEVTVKMTVPHTAPRHTHTLALRPNPTTYSHPTEGHIATGSRSYQHDHTGRKSVSVSTIPDIVTRCLCHSPAMHFVRRKSVSVSTIPDIVARCLCHSPAKHFVRRKSVSVSTMPDIVARCLCHSPAKHFVRRKGSMDHGRSAWSLPLIWLQRTQCSIHLNQFSHPENGGHTLLRITRTTDATQRKPKHKSLQRQLQGFINSILFLTEATHKHRLNSFLYYM
jgi:hypothetical protein